ncbi:hypothetical protein Tco_0520806 [Tanacetum coccineum]
MNSSLVAPSLESRCSSTRVVTRVLRGSFFFSSTTSFSNVVTLLLDWKTDAKFGSVDRGFVASVVGGGVGVDCCGRRVKDGKYYGMTVVQDYALWELIENGNSWVSVQRTAQENGTFVTKMSVPVTAEKKKTNKKNDVWSNRYSRLRAIHEDDLGSNNGFEVAALLDSELIKRYNVVPPPHPLIYNRPKKLDLSYSGLDEFKDPEFKSYGSEDSKQESNIVCDKKSDDSKENSDDSLVKEQVSKDTSSFVESSLNVDKETVFLVDKKVEFVKPKNHEKPIKKSVRYAEMYRSQSPRGNQRNWNGQKSNQLRSDFVMYNKACFICGSSNHVQAQCKYHQREKMVYENNYNMVNYNYTTKRTHLNAQMNMVPRAVLMKTGLKPFNTARTVNTAHPKSIVFSVKPISRFSKSAQSTVKRPYQLKTVLTNKKFIQKNNTAKAKAVNTARPKAVNTTRPHSTVVRVNQENAVKASSYWGKPQQDDT